jgi:uncharacterized membrane protein
MPVWAWLGFISMIAYNTFLLYRAWRHHHFKYGPIVYSLAGTPGYFLFFAVATVVCEVFLITLFGLVIVSTTWGPVVRQ